MKLSDEPFGIRLKPRDHPVVPTQITLLDDVLFGGFRKDSVIHFYGDPGSGKTTFAMQIMANILRTEWRGIWVDCNGAFSLNRFGQVLQAPDLLKSLTLVRPTSFQQQTQVLQQLQYHLDRVGIIIVDPITHFYRAERYREGSQGFFHELITMQLGTLTGIAHLQKIPVIVINYATSTQRHSRPLVAKGFERVERYRFAFTNRQTQEEEVETIDRQLRIEKAPEQYSRNRNFSFRISTTGIAAFQLMKSSP